MKQGISSPHGIIGRDLESRLTQKGQVTIPLEIRARLGIKPRDLVRFEVDGDEVKLKPARSKLLEGYGAVPARRRPEDWTQVRAEIEQAIAADAAGEN
jgi:antitoxin PrlF